MNHINKLFATEHKMDNLKQLRIDLFLYFTVYSALPLPNWAVLALTAFFAMRLWASDLLLELERELDSEDEETSLLTPDCRPEGKLD